MLRTIHRLTSHLKNVFTDKISFIETNKEGGLQLTIKASINFKYKDVIVEEEFEYSIPMQTNDIKYKIYTKELLNALLDSFIMEILVSIDLGRYVEEGVVEVSYTREENQMIGKALLDIYSELNAFSVLVGMNTKDLSFLQENYGNPDVWYSKANYIDFTEFKSTPYKEPEHVLQKYIDSKKV